MVAHTHQHVWEVDRTAWPHRIGWGIACKQCQLILVDGLPKAEVEAVFARLSGHLNANGGTDPCPESEQADNAASLFTIPLKNKN